MNKDSVSIIIPAHNEGSIIGRTLSSLQQGLRPGFEVIVVCNGCSDNTPEIVSGFDGIKSIVTSVASKTHALNLGDEEATGKTRVYLDADIVMTIDDIAAMRDEMHARGAIAITPNVRMNLDKASNLVKMYYKFWLQLPYVKEGFVGGGVYMLSEAGRGRFKTFPDVIADDGYVRSLFRGDEFCRSGSIYSNVSAPRSFSGLIKIFTRSRVGQYQLFALYPESLQELKYDSARNKILLAHLCKPRNFFSGFVYLLVNFICRTRARAQFSRIENYVWETDGTSRS